MTNYFSRFLSTAVIAVSVVSGSLANAQSSSTTTPALNSQQLAMLALINNYRSQNGVGTLQVSIALENSSEWMSNDMATNNYVSHTDSLGRNPFTRMAAFGYPYSPAGENIAAGPGDPQTTFNLWLTACDADASGACTYAHRQNILNASYVVIGIGVAYNATSTYGWYWTTDFGGYLDATISTGSGSASTPDQQPPTAPVLSSAVASSAAEVDLSWSASTDNVGVTGYQITRNGVVLTSVSGTTLTYSDKTVTPGTLYTYSVKAYDAAGNYSNPSNTVQVTTPALPSGSVFSIWSNSATPQFATSGGYLPVEVGVKFRSDVSGAITGIRFYKGSGNTGTHTGSLWSASGSLLATGTFTNETASGWQTLLFSSPVQISANTTYVASYHSSGFYALNWGYFSNQGANNAPLHALQNGVDGPNGVMTYDSSGGQFPAYSGNANNFWVDVLFTTNSPQ